MTITWTPRCAGKTLVRFEKHSFEHSKIHSYSNIRSRPRLIKRPSYNACASVHSDYTAGAFYPHVAKTGLIMKLCVTLLTFLGAGFNMFPIWKRSKPAATIMTNKGRTTQSRMSESNRIFWELIFDCNEKNGVRKKEKNDVNALDALVGVCGWTWTTPSLQYSSHAAAQQL